MDVGRTQTLSVELTRDEIESTLGHMEGGNPEADCATCNVKEKLHAALSQPEQGETPSVVLSERDREELKQAADWLASLLDGTDDEAALMRRREWITTLRNLASQEHLGEEEGRLCPDDGTCHHGCGVGECFRVHHSAPRRTPKEARERETVEAFAAPQALPAAVALGSPFTAEGFAPDTPLPKRKTTVAQSSAELLARQWQTRAEKAEKALEDLAAELDERADVAYRGNFEPLSTVNAHRAAASLCREKAATLKGGEGRG